MIGSSVSRPTSRTSFSVISANASAADRCRSTLSEKERVESRRESFTVVEGEKPGESSTGSTGSDEKERGEGETREQVEDAEEVVKMLDMAGILNFSDHAIRDETGKGGASDDEEEEEEQGELADEVD